MTASSFEGTRRLLSDSHFIRNHYEYVALLDSGQQILNVYEYYLVDLQ